VPSDAERRRATLIFIAPGRQQATLHAAAIAAVVSLLLYLPVYFACFEKGLFSGYESIVSPAASTALTSGAALTVALGMIFLR